MAFCKHRVMDKCKKDGKPCIFSDECFEPEERKPMTNADRIRAMSDEELAKEFADCAIGLYCATRNKWLPELTESVKLEAFNSVLEWLKQPAKEGE